MKKTLLPIAAGLAVLSYSALAPAHESGDWVARVGTHYIDPKSDNNDTVDVKGALGLTGSVSYFIAPQFAAELLLAAPYKHDIELKDGPEVASTRHLPPTLSLVWYPQLDQTWHPFIGAGLNYTTFFDEKTKGPLAGTKLKLDDSFGIAAVVGLQVDFTPQWSIVVDARYFDIDTKAKVDGASIGTVEIDPFGYGVSVGYRF